MSTVPDLSCVVFSMRHRENREAVNIAKPELIICLYSMLAGSLHFGVCVTRKLH